MSDTSPRDQRPLFYGAAKPAPPESQPGELLEEFLVGHDRYRIELRDHGPYGVEAQFFQNEEFFYSRRFDPFLDASRPSREMAIGWAREERKDLERRR